MKDPSDSQKPPEPAPAASPPASRAPESASVEDAAAELFLLNGAASVTGATELDLQKKIAADPSQDVTRRLEAYEDIIDSDIGDTTLSRARNLEREVGLRQIYLKFEGDNPSGTQKDRIAFAQARDALRRGFEVITVATCGNYGAAISMAASLAGLRCVIYIPESYQTKRLPEMTRFGAEIRRTPGDYETAVDESRECSEKNEFYDANPGGANTILQLDTYGEIAYEIYDELRDAPALVAVPVSNGTTLAGIYKGFLSLYRRGKTSKLPRLVAGSAHRKNPIVHAFRHGLKRCQDLDPAIIRETRINEPLINWRSLDGDYALAAVRQTGGWAGDATDKDLLQHTRVLRDKQGLNVLPASTASLSVLLARHRQEPLPGDRYVVVLTGRRS